MNLSNLSLKKGVFKLILRNHLNATRVPGEQVILEKNKWLVS